MVSLLLKGGADPNKRCDATFEYPNFVKRGYTPLMQAAECNSEKVISNLLEYGADPSLKNTNGITALELAISKNKNKSINILSALT